MIDPMQIEKALQCVTNQTTFVQKLLSDTLGWPIGERAKVIDDIAYEWTEDELRAAGLSEKIVGGKAYQIILPGNPWGIFVMEFVNPDVFTTGRGMTGVLRHVLHGLVRKGREGRSSGLPRFNEDNLLFICNHNYERYRFAHFKPAPQDSATAPMTSFGWGPDDLYAIRTLCEFNLRSLEWPDDLPATEEDWLKVWSSAFDVEKVTKRFYQDYADVFGLVESLIGKQKLIAGDELRLFTQSLFNRVMFLRFIERKGWLKFPGQQGSRYLAALATAGGIGGESLYSSRIRPLFFEGLAEEGKQESEAYGSVPLLNGGLFERSELDDKVTDIPNEAFAPIISPSGLLYRFNFTVEESTPLDIEVAVDPEMLGKVFEELVTGRHESGSYYTPRPIVAFMCREALKGHLANRTKAPQKAIAKLVDDHIVHDLTEAHASAIIDALAGLKAVDHACGSGAYLLGLLQELIAIRRALQSQDLIRDPAFLYRLKLHIISQNLYGVDIDPFATEIAKLRLWLSLAVEATQPVPLPNLDFQIETGDSLLGPCDPFALDLQTAALYKIAEEVERAKDEHIEARGDRKAQLRHSIEAGLQKIADILDHPERHGVIDWRVHFAAVFTKNDGFDIVLANPPYVRQELIKDIKPRLREVFGSRVYVGTADLYTYFYARAVQLLAPGGVLAFISSNKFFRAAYGATIRKYLAERTSILSITDFGDSPVFESSVAYPMILVAREGKHNVETIYTNTRVDSGDVNVRSIIEAKGRVLASRSIVGQAWSFTDKRTSAMLGRMEARGTPLKQHVGSRVFRGITTGYNKAFVIDSRTREQLIDDDPKSSELIKPFLQGKDIRRWLPVDEKRWVIATPIGVQIDDYPAVFRHLSQWQHELEQRCDQGNFWWELRACTYYDTFEELKLVSTKVSIRPTFALDARGCYLGNTAYFLPVKKCEAYFLLGVLNSQSSFIYAREAFVGKQNDWYEVQPGALEAFPIPPASDKEKAVLARIVKKCLDAGAKDCTEWEAQIDQCVASLYGLED